MANRARSIQQKFFITEEEEALIRQKMALDGFIIKVNYYDIKKQTAALQKNRRQCQPDHKAHEPDRQPLS